jgi:formamidopyrimidine-DNA glycosylase
MPELPEVETLRRAIASELTGRRIETAELRKLKIFAGTEGHELGEVEGATIVAARRRAKYLIVDLSNDHSMVIHLSLAGQIVIDRPTGVRKSGGHPSPAYSGTFPHRQTHVIVTFDDASVLYLTDIRSFMHLWIVPTAEVNQVVPESRLGIEIADAGFTFDEFRTRIQKRRSARLKPLLLDQSVIAGLGNIYVDESLWGAQLHPEQTVASLDDDDLKRLYEAIREVIDLALTHGVAQIRNGHAVKGAELPRIHGREGQPCPRCGHPIEKFRVVGRGTYICPVCQPVKQLITN